MSRLSVNTGAIAMRLLRGHPPAADALADAPTHIPDNLDDAAAGAGALLPAPAPQFISSRAAALEYITYDAATIVISLLGVIVLLWATAIGAMVVPAYYIPVVILIVPCVGGFLLTKAIETYATKPVALIYPPDRRLTTDSVIYRRAELAWLRWWRNAEAGWSTDWRIDYGGRLTVFGEITNDDGTRAIPFKPHAQPMPNDRMLAVSVWRAVTAPKAALNRLLATKKGLAAAVDSMIHAMIIGGSIFGIYFAVITAFPESNLLIGGDEANKPPPPAQAVQK